MGNCLICGSPFKQVPAGVSKKTGQPYNSFVACSKMGCSGKPGMAAQPKPTYVPETDDKQDSIFISVAANNASEIISRRGIENPGNMLTEWNVIADHIYTWLKSNSKKDDIEVVVAEPVEPSNINPPF